LKDDLRLFNRGGIVFEIAHEEQQISALPTSMVPISLSRPR